MTRVTNEQVKNIIDTSIDDVTPFIETAHLIINEDIANKGVTEARLKLIELYLSAHFVTVKEKQVRSEKVGEASNTYFGEGGMYLNTSTYGQTASVIDPTGILSNKGKTKSEIKLISPSG